MKNRLSNPSIRQSFTVRAGSHTLTLGQKSLMMGIVNCTPDSFSQDGCYKNMFSVRKAINYGRTLIKEGAHILDVGGESTRPGAKAVSIKEEIKRVIPVIQKLAENSSVPISIDTYKPEVAKEALKAGAVIVNNIMGSNLDQRLLEIIRDYHAAIILMHIKGTPRSMQKNIHYRAIIDDIIKILQKSVEKCLEIGIKSDKIIIDPGIGFGKTVRHNLKIVNRLNDFKILKRPLLIGTSRKSFIGKVLERDVKDRLLGTAATVSTSILRGAHIVRVHDVKEMKDIVQMTDSILNERP